MKPGDTLIGYLHPSDVSASFHKSLLALVGWDMAHNRRLNGWASIKCASGGIPEGRNQLAENILQGDCDWLFMIDADMGFEPLALDLLLAVADPVERPIVGGLAFAQREAFDDGSNGFRCIPRPTIFDYVKHDDGVTRFTGRSHYPANTLMRCAATGGAFLVIHRSVFQKIKDNYGPSWFDRIRDVDGSLLGEDISFFARCQALEIPCHVHTGIRSTHLKQLWLGENDFWTSFYAPPATERVDVIVPVLHRPQNVRPLMESLRASTGLATVYFVAEPDDLEEHNEIRQYGAELLICPGTFAQKVNYAYGVTTAPWILPVGDDVFFRPGWLDHAQEVARRYNATVVGTNDLLNPRVMRGEHATHPMIRRDYINTIGASWDGPGIICHEGYRHWFVDDEIVTAAKQRGVFQAAIGSEIEHRHPIGGKVPNDAVYEAGTKHAKADKTLFEKRRKAHLR